MKKTENLWKIVGCFWTWKIVFLVFFFLRLYTYCGLFLCVYHKSAKNACFPQFFVFFGGWLLLLCLGLEGLYVLVFFVFGLLFGVGLVFSLALFCFVLGCCCFCLCFWFVFFCFVGSGEVARRATSLGPKPSLFVLFFFVIWLLFFFLFFSFLFLFLFFWRV